MVRLIATSALVLSAGALLAAGIKLQTSLSTAPLVIEQTGLSVVAAKAPVSEAPVTRQFPPIFGTEEEPAEDHGIEDLVADPDFDYLLKGLIVSGEMRWAILAGPTGEYILREGETLAGGTLSRILNNSVSVDLGATTVELTFDPDQRIELAETDAPTQSASEAMYASAAALWGAAPVEVMYQGMQKEDLVTLLENARIRRNRQGWIR